MKLLSVAIPCYNSQDYMRKCIESVLKGGDEVEIIIIDDGSKDDTGKIADEYADKYKEIVKVIHQPNGGHGEGVNQGVLNSTGLYFKVVDSDDWLNEDALAKLLSRIRADRGRDTIPDMYICNYVYEHSADNSTYTMSYARNFPKDEIIGWDKMKRFGAAQYLMMHSVVFRTEFLQKDYKPLPKHTFFVDNLYMFRPLPGVKTMVYLDLDLYRYFIGREDQSVNEKMLIKRLDQQFRVTELMFESHDLDDVKAQNPNLYKYMLHNLAMMMMINAAFAFVSKEKEKINAFYALWKSLKKDKPALYKKLTYRSYAWLTRLPGCVGRFIFVTGYRIARKIVKFG